MLSGMTAAWDSVIGMSLLPAMHVVLAALPPARAGVGSALITALRK